MWQDMTLRMSKAGVHTMTLTRQTRELQDRFLGSAVSYDAASKFLSASTYGASKEITKILQQGLQIGAGDLNARADAVLAASLFRNIFEGCCSAQQLEAMVFFIIAPAEQYACVRNVTRALRCAMFAASATP